MCITDEILRAKLDGELSEAERLEGERHLAACAGCRERETAMAATMKSVSEHLAALAPRTDEAQPDARLAYMRFRAAHAAAEPSRSFAGRLLARRWPVAVGLVAVAVAVLVSFAPARSWAQKILSMLRVQKVTVVELNPSTLPMANGGRASNMLEQLISDKLVVTESPGKPQPATDSDQASRLSGFRVRLFSDRADQPKIAVEGERGFSMTVDRDRVQAILNEAGRPDLQLPASLDGATVAVHIPKMMFARYGNCPEPRRRGEDGDRSGAAPDAAGQSGSAASSGTEAPCVVLAEVPSPTVSVPPDLNIEQLAEAALQFGGMSADEARAFCQTVDWTSTLVIPIPRDGASTAKVDVDGTEGTLINVTHRGRRDFGAGYSLVWVKNGIIYSVTAPGSSADAVTLADSLD